MLKMPLKKSSFALVSEQFRMRFYGDQCVRHVTYLFKQYFDISRRLSNILYVLFYSPYYTYNMYFFPINVVVGVSKMEEGLSYSRFAFFFYMALLPNLQFSKCL